MKKRGKSKVKRVCIALHIERDADIVTWVEGLGDDDNLSALVRGMIRRYIGQQEELSIDEKLDRILSMMVNRGVDLATVAGEESEIISEEIAVNLLNLG